MLTFTGTTKSFERAYNAGQLMTPRSFARALWLQRSGLPTPPKRSPWTALGALLFPAFLAYTFPAFLAYTGSKRLTR